MSQDETQPAEDAGGDATGSEPTLGAWSAWGLLMLSAVLMVLGFAGFGLWPIGFVGLVPALYVVDRSHHVSGWSFWMRVWAFGTVAFGGGFHWLIDTIAIFGGFPYWLALLFATVFFAFMGVQYGLMLWLWARARRRGFDGTAAIVAAWIAAELLYPKLFANYYGNSFHMLPMLIQVADLGGPLMLSALAALGNGAVYAALDGRLRGRPFVWRPLAVFAAAVVLFLGYGAYRTAEVQARMANAPTKTIGVVQAGLGIFEGRRMRGESRRRHIEQSLELQARSHPDLIVWAEGAAEMVVPEGRNLMPVLYHYRGQLLTTPLLFGASSIRDEDGERHQYNTAFLADGQGNVVDSYDKSFLLAFGEYIPFGDTFPYLYELSPNTSHFTHGSVIRPLPFDGFRLGVLICYEDVSPTYVRRTMAISDPHLLVNMTNDAWFERSQAPWVHRALAKFRAVEHHRYLVRSTMTGVSTIIDPLGRVVVESEELYERTNLHGQVHMLEGSTLFAWLGHWPGFLGAGAILYMAFIGRRRRREGRGVTEAWGEPRHTRTVPPLAHWRAGGEGPPVLFIMGLGMPGKIWRPQIDGLRRAHRVAWFDYRGVGQSAASSGPWDLRDLAADALRVMDACGFDDAHVVGTSMGGMIAQEVALTAPERVRSLTLVATRAAGGLRNRPPWTTARDFFLVRLLHGQHRFAAMHRLLYPSAFVAQADRASLLSRTVEQLSAEHAPGVVRQQLWSTVRFDTRDRLSSLELPVQVLVPGQDRMIPKAAGEDLARRIPGARLVRFADAGHGLLYQCADSVNETLRRFIDEQERGMARAPASLR